jgi:hypothetical protein
MTFFRFRCKGTTLFREVVDAAWKAGSGLVWAKSNQGNQINQRYPWLPWLDFDYRDS